MAPSTLRLAALLAAATATEVSVSETGAVAEASAKQKLRIGLEWFLNPDHMPFVVAEREGFFAEAGLEVELVAPSDPGRPRRKFSPGGSTSPSPRLCTLHRTPRPRSQSSVSVASSTPTAA